MVGRIIGVVSCVMCAIPFFIIATYDKSSKNPINFWSGDTSLKTKVKNVSGYNQEMSGLYLKCAYAFMLTGVMYLISPLIGTTMICFESTLGIYVVYRSYKKILSRYL